MKAKAKPKSKVNHHMRQVCAVLPPNVEESDVAFRQIANDLGFIVLADAFEMRGGFIAIPDFALDLHETGVFARLLLWTDAKPLPAIGDEQGAWDYYLRNWRPGKPTRTSRSKPPRPGRK